MSFYNSFLKIVLPSLYSAEARTMPSSHRRPWLKSGDLSRFLGLGPRSSSQYRMYWLRDMPVHWIRPVHWWSRPVTPAPPRLMRGARRRSLWRAPLEPPCRRHVFTRFSFTKAKKSAEFRPCFKRNLVVLDEENNVRIKSKSERAV